MPTEMHSAAADRDRFVSFAFAAAVVAGPPLLLGLSSPDEESLLFFGPESSLELEASSDLPAFLLSP